MGRWSSPSHGTGQGLLREARDASGQNVWDWHPFVCSGEHAVFLRNDKRTHVLAHPPTPTPPFSRQSRGENKQNQTPSFQTDSGLVSRACPPATRGVDGAYLGSSSPCWAQQHPASLAPSQQAYLELTSGIWSLCWDLGGKGRERERWARRGQQGGGPNRGTHREVCAPPAPSPVILWLPSPLPAWGLVQCWS